MFTKILANELPIFWRTNDQFFGHDERPIFWQTNDQNFGERPIFWQMNNQKGRTMKTKILANDQFFGK